MKSGKLIEEYYNNKEIIAFFKNIANEWWEELRQDVFLTLCEYDENKIVEMQSKKYLKFFIIRIALNQFRSKTSKFYYQNIKNNNLGIALTNDDMVENADAILYANLIYDTQGETAYDIVEAKIVSAEKSIEKLRYFEREILKLYLELGTYKKVSEDTGIPIRTIANGVKNAIKNVQLNIK
jgi:DNA-directed RNA polymerase specialized sigma24 family protein